MNVNMVTVAIAAVGVAKAFNTVYTENVRAGTQFIHPGIVDLAAHAPIGGRNDNYAMPHR